MRQKESRWPVIIGAALCIAVLTASVIMQNMGYLGMLDGDIAADLLLGKRQADTGSLVQMDWLYSTEIHTIHMNMFYALAFAFSS